MEDDLTFPQIIDGLSAPIATKRVEVAFADGERNLKLAIHTIPALAWAALPDGRVEFFNQHYLDFTGLSEEQASGWGWTVAVHPEDLDDLAAAWQRIMASEATGAAEARLRKCDGTFRWFLFRASPLRDGTGTVVKWVGINTDIEDRKRAQEALEASERNLRSIINTIPTHIYVLNTEGFVQYVNQAVMDYTGLTLEDVQQEDYRDRVIHPEDFKRVRAGRAASLKLAAPFSTEQRVLGNDRQYRWFLVRYKPLRDEQGRVVRWYVAASDIEDRKQAEAELSALKDRLYEENLVLRDEVDRTSMFEEIVGTSPALQPVLTRVSKVACTASTVLITGETGTGKELVARAIHRRSPRSSRPFVSVNCTAVPRELIASELFGHEKGAFTGATQRRLGRFELAHGGTIFLDEVGELPMEMQVALLRVLQEREFERVGGNTPIRVDVRVIAATNRDLQAAIEASTFRSDLFYRLNVFPIAVPALRERADDIPLLVEYFIDRYARKAGKTIRRVNKRTLDHLRAYPWPGNVRELQNVIERSVIVCDTEEFIVDESWVSAKPAIEGALALFGVLAAQEKAIIEDALRASGGRVFGSSGAAARLGIPRSTLESKIRTLKINKNPFRARPTKG
jgi:formate hydrogenlyase transcriptional activator